MATGKKSFVLYSDQKELFEHLTDEQAGKLIKHIFKYVNDENPETQDPFIKLAFVTIKASLKRDLSKWEKQLKQRSEAGKKSAESRKRKSTTVNERTRNSTDNVNVSVNDNVNVSVNDNVNEIKEKPPTPKGEFNFDYDKFLIFINKTLGRSLKVIKDSDKKKIRARLKEGYKKSHFENAVKNVKNVTVHIDSNYRHCTMEFFARAKTLDQYGEKLEPKSNQIGGHTEYVLHD